MNPTQFAKILPGVTLGVLLSISADAAKSGSKLTEAQYYDIVKKMAPASDFKPEYPYMTEAQEAKVKTTMGSQRYPAANDDLRSPELKELSATLMQISAAPVDPKNPSINTDRLDAFLASLETRYSTFKSPDTKLFASQLIPLRQLRGVVWKMIGLFEKSDAKATHTAALSAFKAMAGNLRVYSPNENWRVGFDYLTQPFMNGEAPSEQFHSTAELQGFIGGPLYKAVAWSKDELKGINVSDSSQVIVWDQQVALGPKSFVDDIGRFKKIGELEKHMLLSDMYFSLSQMALLRAYSLDGAIEMGKEVGTLYGIQAMPFSMAVEGVTGEDLHNKLKNHPKVGVEFVDRQEFMNKSLDNLKNAAMALGVVWQQAKDRPAGSMWAFDTGFVRLDKEYGDRKIADFRKALNGPVRLRDGISGEEAVVDINGLYTKAPHKIADLLPKTFDQGREWGSVALKDSKGKSYQMRYRNYMKGSPLTWDYEKFKGFYPEVNSNEDLKKAMRVTNSSLGSFSRVLPKVN